MRMNHRIVVSFLKFVRRLTSQVHFVRHGFNIISIDDIPVRIHFGFKLLSCIRTHLITTQTSYTTLMQRGGSSCGVDSQSVCSGFATPNATPGNLTPLHASPSEASSANGPSASPSAGVIVSAQRTGTVTVAQFLCIKCQRQRAVTDLVIIGSQQWCKACKNTYASLRERWAKNAKLKKWWRSLTPEQQVEYFVRWQTLASKERCQAIAVVEEHVYAFDDLDDEVFKFALP
jgi:hypothetical protein